MSKLIFLGTGGGRINLIRQIRKTGGFIISAGGLNISVDPGPGALTSLHELNFPPENIDAVIVTHMHIDHVSDANVLIEAMSGYTLKKGGTLITSSSVTEGDVNGDKSITLYHQSLLFQKIILHAGEEKKITIIKNGKPISFSMRAVKVKHDDNEGFGFVIEIGGLKIGYTSDTEYLPSIHNAEYSGLDLLIANNLKSSDDGIPDHLHSGHTIQLLKAAKPKVCLLTHMGMKIITSSPELEASKIQSESGVKTIAGRDGWRYSIEEGKWEKYAPEKKIKKEEKQKILGD